MKMMIIRNMRLYFRDRVAVFFSLLSVIITIALYVFFLSDTILEGDLAQLEQGQRMLDLWLVAGLLSITCVSAPLAVNGVMVQDGYTLVAKDFHATSFGKGKLMASYVLAAIFSGMIIAFLTLLLGCLFILGNGGVLPKLEVFVKLIGVMLMSVAAGSAMTYLISSFLHSASAFSNASILVGTLLGFLMGIYVPIGALPSFAQNLVRFFPMTQGCAMFRSVLLEEPLQTTLMGYDHSVIVDIKNQLGITLSYGDSTLSLFQNAFILGLVFLVFILFSWIKMKPYKK